MQTLRESDPQSDVGPALAVSLIPGLPLSCHLHLLQVKYSAHYPSVVGNIIDSVLEISTADVPLVKYRALDKPCKGSALRKSNVASAQETGP